MKADTAQYLLIFYAEYLLCQHRSHKLMLYGLAYGVLTKWGFFRHRWIVLKWVVLFLCIGFGIWLGGKEQAMLALSHTLGEEAMAAPEYRAVLLPYCLGGLMQICVLVAVVFISIFKPFGRRT